MKILVSVEYLLVFWIVKHMQINQNSKNQLGQVNQICQINQINEIVITRFTLFRPGGVL